MNNNEIPSKPLENYVYGPPVIQPCGNRERCVRWFSRTLSNIQPSSSGTGLVLPENFMEGNRNPENTSSEELAVTVNAVFDFSPEHSHAGKNTKHGEVVGPERLRLVAIMS